MNFKVGIDFSEEGFYHILNLLKHGLHHIDERGSPLRVDQQLLIGLRFFPTGSFQKVIGDITSISVTVVCRTIHVVAKVLVHKKKQIVFSSQTELPAIVTSFAELLKDHLPGVICAIDCTHILIQCPDYNMA